MDGQTAIGVGSLGAAAAAGTASRVAASRSAAEQKAAQVTIAGPMLPPGSDLVWHETTAMMHAFNRSGKSADRLSLALGLGATVAALLGVGALASRAFDQ